MATETETNATQDKQITVDVPEDRVPEFYAFYARFLAGRSGRRGRGLGRRGHGCRGHRSEGREQDTPEEVQQV